MNTTAPEWLEGGAPLPGSQVGDKTLIIIYGPPASGKTINAEVLRKHYRCDQVLDAGFDDSRIIEARGRILVLSLEKVPKGPKGHRKLFAEAIAIPVQEAAFAVGDAWIPVNE